MTPAPITPALLRRAGEALYGPAFAAPLSARLGVRRDTLRRWLNGREAVPSGAAHDLCMVALCRRDEIGALLLAIGPLPKTDGGGPVR